MYETSLARHNSNAEIWAVDWPNVLELARTNAVNAGIGNRFHTIPGSAFDVEYGADYDLVLVVNFLHHFGKAACEKLLKKVQASLKPGGQVVIVEFVPNEDRVSPPMSATFPLVMLATTADGDAYTFGELERMLRAAGFASNKLHQPDDSPQQIIVSA